MSKRKVSEKFLASVKKNLPPPEHSGPKTEEGKRRVRYNALKHGFNIKGILPCKASCWYREICYIYDDLFNGDRGYIGLCAIEFAEYLLLKESFLDTDNISDDVEDFIMQTILANRTCRYLSINPELRGPGKKLSKAYQLHSRFKGKILKISKRLLFNKDKD